MSELVDFYQQQAKARFSTIPWLLQMQKDAVADFSRLGFPSRHLEDWKYTVVDAFVQQQFAEVKASGAVGQPMPAEEQIPLLHAHKIILNNGVAVGIDALQAVLPKGIIVQPLAKALVEHADKVKPYLNQVLQQQHGFHAMNTAMLEHGLFIYLPAGAVLSNPLLITNWQSNANQASYLRHLVIAEEGSSASIIEDYLGDAQTCYFTNTITEIYLAAHAKLTHYKIQRESKLAFHMGQLAVQQAKASQFDSHSFSIGGKLVRSDMMIGLHEPNAQCRMNGIYTPAEGQHIDHHTVVVHEVPHCRSEQDYKGILRGQSRAVFNGQVIVAKDAQHSEAKQQNKNLLLSPRAEVDTKPQLEIFADDVICTHGATVGQLDEDALFYLATRGIGRAEASRYLILAFAAENLHHFANTELSGWLGTLLNQQLG